MLYDIADYNDPCAILMALEGDEDDRESLWDAGRCVTRGEREREIDGYDMRGASPAELAFADLEG